MTLMRSPTTRWCVSESRRCWQKLGSDSDNSKQRYVTLNLDFAWSVTNLPKTKSIFSGWGKNCDIQHPAKNIEITSTQFWSSFLRIGKVAPLRFLQFLYLYWMFFPMNLVSNNPTTHYGIIAKIGQFLASLTVSAYFLPFRVKILKNGLRGWIF